MVNNRAVRGWWGLMDELNRRLAANPGVERTAGDQVVGIALLFAVEEGPAENDQAFTNTIEDTQHSNSGACLVEGSWHPATA